MVYETKYSRIDQVKFVKAAFKKFEGRESNTFDKSVTKASKVFVLESGNLYQDTDAIQLKWSFPIFMSNFLKNTEIAL